MIPRHNRPRECKPARGAVLRTQLRLGGGGEDIEVEDVFAGNARLRDGGDLCERLALRRRSVAERIRTPRHDFTCTGARKRRSPHGGSANGRARNAAKSGARSHAPHPRWSRRRRARLLLPDAWAISPPFPSLQQRLGCFHVGDEDVDPSSGQCRVNGGVLALAAGEADAVRDPAQRVGVDADDPVVELTVYQHAGGVEVALGHTSPTAPAARSLSCSAGSCGVAARAEQRRRGQAPDADQRHGETRSTRRPPIPWPGR